MPDLSPPTAPVAVGPLPPSADTEAAEAGVVIEDLSLLAKVLVRCDDEPGAAGLLGVGFGRAVRTGRQPECLVVGSGPGEWLLIGPEGTTRELVAQTTAAVAGLEALTSVVDLSHGRALVRLRGPAVPDLLARMSAFDLDHARVRDGSACRTWVAGVVCDLVRDDVPGQTSYLVHCERSSGRYLVETMLAAGADLGAVHVTGETGERDERR